MMDSLKQIGSMINKEQLRWQVTALCTPERERFDRKLWEVLKRASDVLGAVFGLVILSPILLICALAVTVNSKGPVIYSQMRTGLEGKPFRMYKFRSMVEGAESSSPMWCEGPKDPRITSVGAFLRKTHLDELPQLFNVLRGDMSFVGPRPERPEFVTKFTFGISDYKMRHAIRPGITGLAQVNYRYDTSEKDVRRKLKYDLLYLKRSSFLVDLMILWNTLGALTTKQGW